MRKKAAPLSPLTRSRLIPPSMRRAMRRKEMRILLSRHQGMARNQHVEGHAEQGIHSRPHKRNLVDLQGQCHGLTRISGSGFAVVALKNTTLFEHQINAQTDTKQEATKEISSKHIAGPVVAKVDA